MIEQHSAHGPFDIEDIEDLGHSQAGVHHSAAVQLSFRGVQPRRGLLPRGRTLINTWLRPVEAARHKGNSGISGLRGAGTTSAEGLGEWLRFSGASSFAPASGCAAQDELPPKIFGRRGGARRAFQA